MSKVRLAVLSLSLVLVGGCIPSCKTVYQDRDIRVVVHDLRVILNVHASSGSIEIKTAGRSFKNVRGANQAFLRTPNTNVIVFVVEEKASGYETQKLNLHVLNLKTKNDLVIPLGTFGDYDLWIDAAKSDVRVDSYDERRLVLFSTREKFERKGPDGKFVPIGRLEIDLDKKLIVSSTESK